MAISENLKKALEISDITGIRSSFYTIILSDPGFKTNRFDEALEYVKATNITGIIDVHDGEKILPKEEWDEAYFDSLSSKLLDNFSEERIEQIKIVARALSASVETNEKKVFSNDDKKITTTTKNKNKDELNWVGIIGFALLVIWIIRQICKGGK